MTINFLITALLGISTLTGLVVEGLKKLLDGTKIKYSSNILAVIVSIVISLVSSVIYLCVNKVPFDSTVVVEVIVLMFLSFLVSTVGYDKVVQTLKQMPLTKNEDSNENEKNNTQD